MIPLGLLEMDSYRSHVEALATRADGELVLNRSPAHASIVLEAVFNASSEIVEILTSKLAPEVYGEPELIEAAARFLDRPKSSIAILSESEIDRATHPFLVALDARGFADRISIRCLPAASLKRYSFNFAVGDRRHFRFEQSRDSFEAFARFGVADIGTKLNRIFADLDRSIG
ncbi:MAG: hypothetical protein QOJ15_1947 [Bradyrhizobium sp.]|jgi:hypothetical protein|nr:hypothetical protein [Bradyrhizobium sp.]